MKKSSQRKTSSGERLYTYIHRLIKRSGTASRRGNLPRSFVAVCERSRVDFNPFSYKHGKKRDIYIYKKREGRLKTLKEGTHCGTWTLSWTGLGATVEEFLWWLSHVCHVPSPAVSPPCPRNSTPRRRFSRSRILSALLLEKRTENEIKNHPLLLFPLLRVPISSSFKDGQRTNWFFVIEFFFVFRIIQFF